MWAGAFLLRAAGLDAVDATKKLERFGVRAFLF
jgi:hypothetical protein